MSDLRKAAEMALEALEEINKLSTRRGKEHMTKDELAAIVEKMPQGMDADDYILELVNRAVAVEVKGYKARISLLERENAWLESHGA